jgi:hypothetical protein
MLNVMVSVYAYLFGMLTNCALTKSRKYLETLAVSLAEMEALTERKYIFLGVNQEPNELPRMAWFLPMKGFAINHGNPFLSRLRKYFDVFGRASRDASDSL